MAIPRIALTVRVYQTAGLTPVLQKRALAEAERVLRSGIVDVNWRDCTDLNSSAACDVPLEPSELLLVLRDGATCQSNSGMLGEALVNRGAGGVLAAVNVVCVASLASAARRDLAVLLGRVAAHELGHLVMRTSAHARHGVMRPNWTPDEVRRNRAVDWAFTAADVAAMWRLAVNQSGRAAR